MNFLAHALVAESASGADLREVAAPVPGGGSSGGAGRPGGGRGVDAAGEPGGRGELAGDPLFVLGAVLPDLASVAGVRIERSRLAGPVASGARCHVLADAAFHACHPFRAGAAAIRRDLAEEGLSRGAARAVGHVGWELLLDGTLVGSLAEDSFRQAVAAPEAADATVASVAAAERRRWVAFLDRRRPWPRLRYDDPAWVAERVAAMLAPRPLLRFPLRQLSAVVRVFERHAPGVTALAGEALAITAAAVVAEGGRGAA